MKENRKTGFKKNPVGAAFQELGIWFKDTAWIQVVLVVVVVFAIVFSIPFIVSAINSTDTDSDKTMKFLESKRVNYNELNSRLNSSKEEYTVVFYYDGSSTTQTVGNLIRKNIFEANKKYYDDELFGKYFVTFDIHRTKENAEKATDTKIFKNKNDYDVTDAQIEAISKNYQAFYDGNIRGKNLKYEDSSKTDQTFVPVANSSDTYVTLTNSATKYVIPAGVIAVYKNGSTGKVETINPAWLDLGIDHTGGDTAFMDELIASVNYNLADPKNPYKILIDKK